MLQHEDIDKTIWTTYLFHECVCNGHSRELRSTPMRPLLAVPTQTRNLAEIEVELLNKPVDGIARFVGEDFDQVVSSEFTS